VSVKRGFDLVVSSTLLFAAAPIMLAVALMVRLFLGPPVIFRQLRPGLEARPFALYKFRTMHETKLPDGKQIEDHERLTRLGRALRATSLDELPELWNVLRGDMSLVGPRPLLLRYLPLYDREQFRRHEARPGITGLAQVEGRNALPWERRFELDAWYVDNQSLLLDLRILLLTVLRVVTANGVAQPGRATVDYFTGQKLNKTREPQSHDKPYPRL